jgi:hypothetical protein
MSSLFENNKRLGSKYWINSEEKNFSQLVQESKMIQEFSDSSILKKKNYEEKLIVPVNPYVEYFYPKPKLIETETGIILRQKTHAEIWVEYKNDSLYMLDKCWQRQFYPSKNTYDNLNNQPLYRFYVPWTIESENSFEVKSVSPVFNIYTKSITFFKRNFNDNFINTPFIDFSIKKQGKHMKTEKYGIVDIGTDMYDIVIDNSNIAERIVEEYGKDI